MITHNYTFESMDDLIQAKRVAFANEENARHQFTRDPGQGSYRWICADRDARTNDDVCRHLAAQTFPAGVARVEELAATFNAPAPMSRRRKPCRADYGDDLDMSRVWQGDLENAWRTMRREQTVGPSRILIAINIAGSVNIRAEALAYRGAAAFALATSLLDAGYVVSIVACAHTTLNDGSNTPYNAEVSLLQPGGVFDIHKLCSLVASALLFRGVLIDHSLRVSQLPVDEGISRSKSKGTWSANSTGFDYTAVMEYADNYAQASAWLQKQIQALGENHV